MKNSQKGYIVPLVIAIVVVLLAGGAYLVYKNDNMVVGPGSAESERQLLNSAMNRALQNQASTTTDENVHADEAGQNSNTVQLPRAIVGTSYMTKLVTGSSAAKIMITDGSLPKGFFIKYMQVEPPCVPPINNVPQNCQSDDGFWLVGTAGATGSYSFAVQIGSSTIQKFHLTVASVGSNVTNQGAEPTILPGQPTESPSTTWQTYTNNSLSVGHPSSLNVYTSGSSELITSFSQKINSNSALSISVINNSPVNASTYVSQLLELSNIPSAKIKAQQESNVSIDGTSAMVVELISSKDNSVSGTHILFQKGNTRYEIIGTGDYSTGSVFEEFYNSFKFINSN